jgi:hypothetical protein
LLIGVARDLTLSVAAWILSASLLLAVLAYPVGGTLGCLVAGLGLAHLLPRHARRGGGPLSYHQRSPIRSAS